ncbi:MAG: hypothetical protein ACXW0M_09910, partial [Methylosarcina sp.]
MPLNKQFKTHNNSIKQRLEYSMTDEKRSIRRRGIYLLPNLFTTGALFSGFYAITSAMNGR